MRGFGTLKPKLGFKGRGVASRRREGSSAGKVRCAAWFFDSAEGSR